MPGGAVMTLADRLRALRCAAEAIAEEKDLPADEMLRADLRTFVRDLSGHIEDLESGS
jgi:hypothetical protein